MERRTVFNNSFVRRRAIRRVRFFFLFFIILFVAMVVKLFTVEFRYRMADSLGTLAFRYGKKGRNKAIEHLQKAYGDTMTQAEIEEAARQVFVNLVKVFADYVCTTGVTTREDYLKFVEIEGEEHLKKAYEKGKGVICLIPHLSSWEFSAITPPLLGYETSAASKAVKNIFMNKMMVHLREKRGMKNISRDNSYEKLIEVLNKGECLIIMIDQDTRVMGVHVDFYGHQAYTPIGVTRLALDTEAVIVPMAMTRKPDNTYKFIILPEEPLIRTGDEKKDILVNTQRHTELMEYFIRLHPEQWVWMHDRWRTTPEKLERHLKRRKELKQEAIERQQIKESRWWYKMMHKS